MKLKRIDLHSDPNWTPDDFIEFRDRLALEVLGWAKEIIQGEQKPLTRAQRLNPLVQQDERMREE